uniref:Uncharacterized protein n=1 Tax=Oryza barthii TaxID=65489 RepID=A0A0D3GXD1_9ORYZ
MALHTDSSVGKKKASTSLIIDIDNIGATNIPIDAPPTVFHKSWLYISVDEWLSLLYLCDNKLHIWTKLEAQEGGRLLWNCTQSICVGVKMGLFGTESLSTVCIGEESGSMLTLYLSDPNSAYVLDLPSGSITSVDDWKRWFNYMTAWKILLKLDEVPTLEQTTKAIQEAIDALRPS